MSILSNIFDRLVHHANPQAAPSSQSAPSQNTTASAPQPTNTGPAQGPQASAQAAPTGLKNVDMEQVLEDLAAKNPQKLNWRTSIVDLLKLLGMDSSLQQRKELADELGYKADKGDSAAMNTWLHEQVIQKVAQNGGKVPADMLH